METNVKINPFVLQTAERSLITGGASAILGAIAKASGYGTTSTFGKPREVALAYLAATTSVVVFEHILQKAFYIDFPDESKDPVNGLQLLAGIAIFPVAGYAIQKVGQYFNRDYNFITKAVGCMLIGLAVKAASDAAMGVELTPLVK